MGLIIIRLTLGVVVVLIFTLTLPYSVLAQTPNPYNRPSLQDKTGEYAIVLSPRGCVAFIYNNGADSYRYVCWDADAQIFPDYDGYYRMTLYTGFTADPRLALVHPKYKQDYTWEKHRKVYINSAGCLRPYGHDWGIPEALGPCPPTLYSQHEPNIMNPYRKRDWDRRRMLGPALDGIHDFLIKPLLQEQPIIYPDNPDAAGTDPNLGYDFKPFAVPDELTTAEPPAYSSPAPVGQF